jgi:hypothetical protein
VEQGVIEKNKEKQRREGADRDQARQEEKKSKRKENKEPKQPLSTAMLVQESKPRRTRDSSSPSTVTRHLVMTGSRPSRKNTTVPVHGRSPSSSSSNGGVAIDD